VTPQNVRELVHGAIFTRGPEDLASTAIFIGGSDVGLGEQVLEAVRSVFFGPLRVSVLLDSNGANTTASAAVLAAVRHLAGAGGKLDGLKAVVLGATGPVGRRAVRLLVRSGARVTAVSRVRERALAVARDVERAVSGAGVEAAAAACDAELARVLDGSTLVVSAGATGARMLPAAVWQGCAGLRLVVDLNAVPPEGVEGVQVQDAGKERSGRLVYGAIGVGGIKMKIHRACVAGLFESRERILDAEEVFGVASKLPPPS
jgi:hypothetical protein